MQIDKITTQIAEARQAKSQNPGLRPRACRRRITDLLVMGMCCLFGCLPGLLLAQTLAQTSSAPATFSGGGEIRIAVSGQAVAERNNAYRVGLRWLLQRYANRTGEVGIINHEETREALGTSENYVDAFEYARIPEGTSVGSQPASRAVRESGIATHWLTVQYSIPALDKLVALTRIAESSDESDESAQTNSSSGRASAWSNESLLWMLVQDDANELWVSHEITPHVVVRLTEVAGEFGTVIHFPTFDTTDLAMVGPENLESLDETAELRLRETASRYRYPRLVAGIVERQIAGGWQLGLARFDLTDAERPSERLDAEAPTLDSALQVLAGWMSGVVDATGKPLQSLSGSGVDEPLSFGGNSDASARIWFDGVVDGGSYRRIHRYLQEFDGLERARMLEINSKGVLFEVSPRSSLTGVSRALQSQTWLELGQSPQAVEQNNESSAQISDTTSATSAASTSSEASVSAAPVPKADLYMRYVF